MSKLTQAQQKVLKAYQDLPDGEFVGQGATYRVLGNKYPHPNTLDALVKKGLLEQKVGIYMHRACD